MSRKRGQVEIVFPTRVTWGGKRRGAGRPRGRDSTGAKHKQRQEFARPMAVHVTMKVVKAVRPLRIRDVYFALRRATKAVLIKHDFRVVHLSPEGDHLHVIVEADTSAALARGMQAFEISAARYINQAISKRTGTKRRGQVFADRYFPRFITSPTQARNTISYVLNNFRRHRQDVISYDRAQWDVDYMSSAVSFDGWAETEAFLYQIRDDDRLCVSTPTTWLLRAGWQRAGTISKYTVPRDPWKRS